jgi:hypothetical protein
MFSHPFFIRVAFYFAEHVAKHYTCLNARISSRHQDFLGIQDVVRIDSHARLG